VHRSSLLLLASLALAACSPVEGDGGDTDDTDVGTETIDVRVPDPEPDAEMVDLLAPEIDIPPYSDHMWCYYLEPTTEDMVANNLEASQGQYGHHIVVLQSKVAKEAGVVEDCTDADQMPNFRPMVLPDTELDPGYGVLIPAGTQPVMQIHYVNPTDKVLKTRDVARLHLIDRSTVTKWAATFATNHDTFVLPAGETTTVTYDCEIPSGTEVLLFGGHMHEWGTRFEASLGTSEETMASSYLVDPWVPEFRDAPPVNLYFESPLEVAEGTKLRTSCTWHNDQSESIAFPHEMCSTFGYLAGTQEPWICEIRE
jgi:hypothetical protein